MWPDTALLDRLNIDLPILLAPMAGAGGVEMALSVARAGGLASLPCGMLDVNGVARDLNAFREASNTAPVNLNFFCHQNPKNAPERDAAWRALLQPYYDELGAGDGAGGAARAPFDADFCALVEEMRPEVLSFHFGLPEPALLDRVKAAGCLVLSSATTVAEAIWLEQHGCDVIIAQGAEAGGHRAMFLTDDIHAQPGLFALLPQIVDAVSLPVVAAGGIADGRGMAAAIMLGASAVQPGTVYLNCPESLISSFHRKALETVRDNDTAMTNLFSGRPARGIYNRIMREIGPVHPTAPAFPNAGHALAPLKAASEGDRKAEFSNMWAGQAAALSGTGDAEEKTKQLAEEARKCLDGAGRSC